MKIEAEEPIEIITSYAKKVAGDGIWDRFKAYFLLLKNPNIPNKIKFLPIILIIYIISPIDFIPDVIPVLGWGDDLIALFSLVILFKQLTNPINLKRMKK